MNAADLVYSWTHPETGVTFEPLIVMLENAVATGGEHSRGGGTDPATRSVVAVDALDMLRRMDSAIGPIVGGMPRLWRFRAVYYWAAEQHVQRWLDRFERWANEVWAMFEPPKTRPLRNLACPVCGSTGHVTSDGSALSAVVLYVDGEGSYAECRNCGKTWVGWAGLVLLGLAAGTEPDVAAVSGAITGGNMSDR